MEGILDVVFNIAPRQVLQSQLWISAEHRFVGWDWSTRYYHLYRWR